MKVTLQYQLPEENEMFELALEGAKLSCIIEDLDNYLRGKIKYDTTITEEQAALYQEIRAKLVELRNERMN